MSKPLIQQYYNQLDRSFDFRNTYCCADYKEHVIDLLKRVCTVSVETMEIINEMKTVK